MEIQALAEMYNRPIHIYSYSTGSTLFWVKHGSGILFTDFLLVHHEIALIPDYMNAEPINIFHGSYDTDTPPIRLSYHHGNHYNSLVDPRRLAIGAGLGFSSLRGVSGCYSFCPVLFYGAMLIPQ